MNYLKLAYNMVRLKIMGEITYRGQFILQAVGCLIYDLLGVFFGAAIYGFGISFPGWSFGEYLVLFGSFVIIENISCFGFGRVHDSVRTYVHDGKFDTVLVKPISTLLNMMFEGFSFSAVFGFLGGCVVVVYGAVSAGIDITLFGVFGFLVTVILGVGILAAISIVGASLSLIYVKEDVSWLLMSMVKQSSKWPLNIYGHVAKIMFTFVVPIGLLSFYPASFLRGGFNLGTLVVLIGVSAFFFGLTLSMFNFALKRYNSAGG